MWQLYKQKRYIEAISEARRLEKYDSNAELDFFIYGNYYLAGLYEKVILHYEGKTHSNLCTSFLLSMSYLNLERYEESYNSLSMYKYGNANNDFFLFRQRIFPLILLDDRTKIKSECFETSHLSQKDNNFNQLISELLKYSSTTTLSPEHSALLSALLPGAGQIYCARFFDGLISFASVAATAFAGYHFYKKDEKAISYTLFFFSGLFYTGNIYGAYNCAATENKKRAIKEYNYIKAKYGSYTPEDCFTQEEGQ